MVASLKKVGFVGHSHLSVVSSIGFAEKTEDWQTQIFGLSETELLDPLLGIEEPELRVYWQKHHHRLSWSNDANTLKECDLVYVALDVPTDEGGNSNLDPLQRLLSRVLPILSASTIVVIQSQVPPGFMRGLSFPKERLFYQVETLIFGEALQRALVPERFIIGSTNPTQALPKGYQAFLNKFECPRWIMSYESAELAKMAINGYLAVTVTMSNTLAAIAETIGADWQTVVPSLQADKRIGPFAYLRPGLGLSGGNLRRDLVSLRRIAAENGVYGGVLDAILSDSEHRKHWVLKILRQIGILGQSGIKIALWGLTYKVNTDSVKDSPALFVLNQLPAEFSVQAFDPMVSTREKLSDFSQLTLCQTPESAAADADVLIIMTPWPIFQTIDQAEVLVNMRQPCVLDPFRVFNAEVHRAADIWQLGQGRHSRQ